MNDSSFEQTKQMFKQIDYEKIIIILWKKLFILTPEKLFIESLKVWMHCNYPNKQKNVFILHKVLLKSPPVIVLVNSW